MEIRNSRLFGMAVSADHDPIISLHESYVKCGMTYANLLSAFADGTERWMRRSSPEDEDRPDSPEPADTLVLLSRAGWIGELNLMLAVLTAKYRQILPRLSECAADADLTRAAAQASASLWDSSLGWGVALCRLLLRLHLRLQSRPPDAATVRRYCQASVLALQQLQDLLIQARRWRTQCRGIQPDMPERFRPPLLERGLKRLERAWLAARFCRADERRANLLQIGLLQHWTAGLRAPYVSRHAFVRRQKVWPRPWLNQTIRCRISG